MLVRSTQVRDDLLPQGAQSLDIEEENSDFENRIAHSLRKICNYVSLSIVYKYDTFISFCQYMHNNCKMENPILCTPLKASF